MRVCGGGGGNRPREMTEDLLHGPALFVWGIYSDFRPLTLLSAKISRTM